MTVTFNIHDAKTNLSKLIERALAGEEVVIAKAGKPVVRLAPIVIDKPKPGSWIGSLKGKIEIGPDFEFTNEEIELFYADNLDLSPLMEGVAESDPEDE